MALYSVLNSCLCTCLIFFPENGWSAISFLFTKTIFATVVSLQRVIRKGTAPQASATAKGRLQISVVPIP